MWTQNTKKFVSINLFDATRFYSNRAFQSAKKSSKLSHFALFLKIPSGIFFKLCAKTYYKKYFKQKKKHGAVQTKKVIWNF